MKAGDIVRWKPTYRPNGQPMPVHDVAEPGFVRLDGPQGSIVSTTLLELVESAPRNEHGETVEEWKRRMEYEPVGQEDGLLAVIDMQMIEMDRLVCDLEKSRAVVKALNAEADSVEAFQAGADEGFREEVERMLGNLCIALGYDRRPLVKTGIHELDVLCRFVGDA